MQQFIGIIKQEHKHRQSRKPVASKLPEQAMYIHGCDNAKLPLASWISGNTHNQRRSPPLKKYCNTCQRTNHWISQCWFAGKPKCKKCGQFRHTSDKCWNTAGNKHPFERSCRDTHNTDTPVQANDAEMEEHIVFNTEHNKLDVKGETAAIVTNKLDMVEEPKALIADNDKLDILDDTYDREYYNFDHVPSSDKMDMHLIYYDWLADTATTSHITHWHNTFITYKTIPDVPISGVGGLRTCTIKQGRVNLRSECDGKIYILELYDVLHVPGNCNNLLSLGRWEVARRSYRACDGILDLLMKEGKPIARGIKVRNNLYKVMFKHAPEIAHSDCVFSTASPSQTWETWHWQFGHVRYSSIKKLLDNQLVDGLHIDVNSLKLDCIACTEVKLSETPYGPTLGHPTKPSELTHMDLWGKYNIASINGNQYYLLMVDDAMQYITVKFLKTKDQVVQKIMNYMTYQKVWGKTPCTIWADRGTEFVNEALREWYYSQGIELQVMAPYSPSQNGVAEQMNCMLVKLAHAILLASELLEFLWEAAVMYAAYLRNMSYTKPKAKGTLY